MVVKNKILIAHTGLRSEIYVIASRLLGAAISRCKSGCFQDETEHFASNY